MKWTYVFNLLKYRKRLLEYNCSSQKRELNIGIKRENPNFVECSDISVSCGLLKVVFSFLFIMKNTYFTKGGIIKT